MDTFRLVCMGLMAIFVGLIVMRRKGNNADE
jgi:hypothetical protein